MEEYSIKPIAHIHNDFKEKFGIPRQSGLVPSLESRIIFTDNYRDPSAVRGLSGFSHIWLIWLFSENLTDDVKDKPFSPTVRPPRLGGNERIGVFATRSPNRPNPIGLSLVKVVSIDIDDRYGTIITVSGADLMDRTPILDIKPYIPYADMAPDAVASYASKAPSTDRLSIKNIDLLPDDIDRDALTAILGLDVRPAYHHDDERIYGIHFGDYNIRFKTSDDILTIVSVAKLEAL